MNTKGITYNRKLNKYVAQYWNKDIGTTIYIGTYDTLELAVDARAKYIRDVYDGLIDETLPKTKQLPKGVTETKSNNYAASLQFIYGKHNNKKINAHLGVYETPELASEARKEFILNLI